MAAVIAYANAAASAQLAAVYPTSGGTYVFGRERLGEWWGFTAGWAFVVGKTASCAAMALTFAAYVVPGSGWTQRLVALAAVLALGATNYRGITRTARLSRVLVAVTLASLAAILVGTWLAPGPLQPLTWSVPGGAYGVLQAAGLLFFAFAGYARIATLGEEVRDPRRTIPTAILGALAIVVVLYAAVGWTALAAAGPQRLAASSAPLTEAVLAAGAGWLVPVVQVGAAVASLGALLSLLAGVGRTMLAMARNADLPDGAGSRPPGIRHAAPRRAAPDRRGRGSGAHRRPDLGDRLLLLRRARLLRHRQRGGLHPAGARSPLATVVQRVRRGRLPDPRRHPSPAVDAGWCRGHRRRPDRPDRQTLNHQTLNPSLRGRATKPLVRDW